ncbi:MAG: hypothetical protein ACRDQU_03115 [Pseudonocardiaceae bacterium]
MREPASPGDDHHNAQATKVLGLAQEMADRMTTPAAARHHFGLLIGIGHEDSLISSYSR